MKRLQKTLAASFAGLMLLTGCTGGSKEKVSAVDVAFPTAVENNDEAVDGQILRLGLVLDSPFKGLFSSQFYEGNDDAEIMRYTMWGAFAVDSEFRIINDEGIESAIKPVLDKEAKTVTLNINEKFTWSDGTPVTADDIVYTYEVVGHKDYTGVRYDQDMQNVEGIVEFHEGKADKISGVKKIDEKTVEVKFKEVNPSLLWGSGIPPEFMPYHQIKDIPVAKLQESDAIRKNPLSYGPYYISEVVPGEKVLFKANPYYWKGEPLMKELLMEVVNTDTVVEAVKAGKYDILVGFSVVDKYEQLSKLNNITIVGRPELSYSYIGFKLGKYDKEKGYSVTDPNAKMSDVNLRKAIGHSLDMQAICDKLYFGLRTPANSLIPPVFKSFHTDREDAILYDLDKANAILDEAGYKDVDGDGIREDKNGEKLTINIATMAGGDLGDSLAQFYTQSLEGIGLNAVLVTGRPIEFNSFYDKVQADDPEIDVYVAAWGTGTNPEPSGLYGREAVFNFSRYTNPELDEILKDINSEKAFDSDFLAESYKKFEAHMIENAPVIPTQFRYEINAINKRVKGFDWAHSNNDGLIKVQVTAEETAKHEDK